MYSWMCSLWRQRSSFPRSDRSLHKYHIWILIFGEELIHLMFWLELKDVPSRNTILKLLFLQFSVVRILVYTLARIVLKQWFWYYGHNTEMKWYQWYLQWYLQCYWHKCFRIRKCYSRSCIWKWYEQHLYLVIILECLLIDYILQACNK